MSKNEDSTEESQIESFAVNERFRQPWLMFLYHFILPLCLGIYLGILRLGIYLGILSAGNSDQNSTLLGSIKDFVVNWIDNSGGGPEAVASYLLTPVLALGAMAVALVVIEARPWLELRSMNASIDQIEFENYRERFIDASLIILSFCMDPILYLSFFVTVQKFSIVTLVTFGLTVVEWSGVVLLTTITRRAAVRPLVNYVSTVRRAVEFLSRVDKIMLKELRKVGDDQKEISSDILELMKGEVCAPKRLCGRMEQRSREDSAKFPKSRYQVNVKIARVEKFFKSKRDKFQDFVFRNCDLRDPKHCFLRSYVVIYAFRALMLSVGMFSIICIIGMGEEAKSLLVLWLIGVVVYGFGGLLPWNLWWGDVAPLGFLQRLNGRVLQWMVVSKVLIRILEPLVSVIESPLRARESVRECRSVHCLMIVFSKPLLNSSRAMDLVAILVFFVSLALAWWANRAILFRSFLGADSGYGDCLRASVVVLLLENVRSSRSKVMQIGDSGDVDSERKFLERIEQDLKMRFKTEREGDFRCYS